MAAEVTPPAHLAAVVGEPPADAAGRRAWCGLAYGVESYRDRHPEALGHEGAGGVMAAIGPRPAARWLPDAEWDRLADRLADASAIVGVASQLGSPAFFAQADLVELGPLGQEAVTALIHDGFSRTGRRAGPVALRVVGFAGGHPQRTMLLADEAWRRTPEATEATEDTWAAALAAVRISAGAELSALYEELPGSQGAVLRAVARTGSPFAATEIRFHDLSKSSITAARDALVRDGHLAQDGDGKVSIVDPVLADWLQRTFP